MNSLESLTVKLCCEDCKDSEWVFVIDETAYVMCDEHMISEQYRLGVTEIIKIKTNERFTPNDFFRNLKN